MPLYEYKCDSCGEVFEILQRFSDAPLELHESCGGRVERLLSAPALQFKGTGWYITDYARKGSGSNGQAQEGGAAEKAPAKKNESAPATSSPAESKQSKPAQSDK